MNIAIIGTGNVGGALAKGWARAGHKIALGVRDTQNFKGKDLLNTANISAYTIADAVKQSEAILLATPPQAIADVVKAMGDVNGKIIIDAINSVRAKPEGYNNTFEALMDLAKGAELAKCFNTTGFENMANPVYHQDLPIPHEAGIDMFVAGDSQKAKDTAIQLAKDAGFAECYDFGGSDKAALLEQLVLIWINLALGQKMGRNIAFKILKR
jgi:predicted dinucleotide-binding enzyme